MNLCMLFSNNSDVTAEHSGYWVVLQSPAITSLLTSLTPVARCIESIQVALTFTIQVTGVAYTLWLRVATEIKMSRDYSDSFVDWVVLSVLCSSRIKLSVVVDCMVHNTGLNDCPTADISFNQQLYLPHLKTIDQVIDCLAPHQPRAGTILIWFTHLLTYLLPYFLRKFLMEQNGSLRV